MEKSLTLNKKILTLPTNFQCSHQNIMKYIQFSIINTLNVFIKKRGFYEDKLKEQQKRLDDQRTGYEDRLEVEKQKYETIIKTHK